MTRVQGFGDEPKDYDIRIDNAMVGPGMLALWSIK